VTDNRAATSALVGRNPCEQYPYEPQTFTFTGWSLERIERELRIMRAQFDARGDGGDFSAGYQCRKCAYEGMLVDRYVSLKRAWRELRGRG